TTPQSIQPAAARFQPEFLSLPWNVRDLNDIPADTIHPGRIDICSRGEKPPSTDLHLPELAAFALLRRGQCALCSGRSAHFTNVSAEHGVRTDLQKEFVIVRDQI